MAALGTISNTSEVATQTIQYATPNTGDTVTIATDSAIVIINPSGTLANLTIVMPASPVDKSIVCIMSSQVLTSITHTSSKTCNGALTTLAANGFAQYIYNSTADKWFRCG